MTQLSNVLMQPKPDAIERPMALIEKLEYKESEISKMMQADDAPFPYHYMAGSRNPLALAWLEDYQKSVKQKTYINAKQAIENRLLCLREKIARLESKSRGDDYYF